MGWGGVVGCVNNKYVYAGAGTACIIRVAIVELRVRASSTGGRQRPRWPHRAEEHVDAFVIKHPGRGSSGLCYDKALLTTS
jgi:hypothetical protein